MLTDEQKLYPEGFIRAVAARGGSQASPAPQAATAESGSPLHAIHRDAQDRFVASGRKLTPEEEAKRRKNPFDMWDEIRANAEAGRFPKGTDVFLHKFHGLFYVAPAQNSFMCRLRMPGGILSSHQLRGLAGLAETCGGRYADITTPGHLPIREIAPRN